MVTTKYGSFFFKIYEIYSMILYIYMYVLLMLIERMVLICSDVLIWYLH